MDPRNKRRLERRLHGEPSYAAGLRKHLAGRGTASNPAVEQLEQLEGLMNGLGGLLDGPREIEIGIDMDRFPSDLPLPSYQTAGAACMDIHAAVENVTIILPGERALIPTGLYVEIPDGHKLAILPRSGLAIKAGITVLNSPGTIDSDYRNEIGIVLFNSSQVAFTLNRGDRIAQCELVPVVKGLWKPQRGLTATDRGTGGFGSTGGSDALKSASTGVPAATALDVIEQGVEAAREVRDLKDAVDDAAVDDDAPQDAPPRGQSPEVLHLDDPATIQSEVRGSALTEELHTPDQPFVDNTSDDVHEPDDDSESGDD